MLWRRTIRVFGTQMPLVGAVEGAVTCGFGFLLGKGGM